MSETSGSHRRRRELLAVALLVLLPVGAYLPALGAGFVWDDDDYVTENPTLHEPGGLARIWGEPGAVPQYYPLVHTTYWLEYRLWGLDPRGYHAVNVLLHALNGVLLFLLLRRLSVPGAWGAAALFALHPVMVESVAWITERKNVLSGVFVLLAARCAWEFHEGELSRRRRLLAYLAALVCFALALSSKTVAGTLPAALLVLLWWKRGRLRGRDVVPLLPFFALAAAMAGVTIWMEETRVGAEGSAWQATPVERFLVAGRAVCFYLGKLLWPHPLAFFYERWDVDARDATQYLYPAGVLAGLALLAGFHRRLGRGPLAAALLFVGTLFPALGFVDVYPMRFSFVADHFQYLAAMPVIAGVVALVREKVPWRRVQRAALAVVLGLFAVLVGRQARVYENLETLWRDTLAKTPSSAAAHFNLAYLLRERGDSAGALEHFRRAAAHAPEDLHIRFDCARILEQAGLVDEAEEHYAAVLRATPLGREDWTSFLKACINLAILEARRGKLEAAAVHLDRALAAPREEVQDARLFAAAHGNRARVFHAQGLPAQAAPHWKASLAIAWRLATAPDPAARDGEQALELGLLACRETRFQIPEFLDVLAAAHAELGQFEDAARTAAQAVQLLRERGDADPAMEERLALYRASRPYRQSR